PAVGERDSVQTSCVEIHFRTGHLQLQAFGSQTQKHFSYWRKSADKCERYILLQFLGCLGERSTVNLYTCCGADTSPSGLHIYMKGKSAGM
ncbi:Nucleotide-binding protein, partial [Dissostichus eleginoides]